MQTLIDYKPGDIIAFSGFGRLSNCINLATYGIPHWNISHVGIVAHAYDRLFLFESTMQSCLPCAITGKFIRGAQAHRINEVTDSYNGRIWHYPLYRELYYHEEARLEDFLLDTIGTPYDEMGAFRSAGIGLSWIESCFREENLSSIFCSEWCIASLSIIGIYPTDNVSRWNPNKLCRTLRRNGILHKPVRKK